MKVSHLFFSIAFLALTWLSDYRDVSAQTQDHDLIQQKWNQFVEDWNDLNAEGCITIYTDDAEVIAPEMQATKGKEAIAEFYNFLFTSNKSADYTHMTETISVEGNQAIEYGNFSVDWVSNEGQSWTYRARVMVHWIKDSPESWKIQRILFNNPPAQEP